MTDIEPPLRHFLAGWFYQGWNIGGRDGTTWQEEVEDYISVDSEAARRALIQLDDVLGRSDAEAAAWTLVADGFDPDEMGEDRVAWLHSLRDELARLLEAAGGTANE